MTPGDPSRSDAPIRLVVMSATSPGSPPRAGEVQVWVLSLATSVAETGELVECLTPDEQQRAARYKVEKARHQFVTGRGTLRRILGSRLGVAPLAVPLAFTGAGKPVLAGATAGLHFNVTHTDGLALIALASYPVGIDVEAVRDLSNPDGLVSRFFSAAEAEAYRRMEPCHRRAGFFRGWTCKEAVIKAAGLSVACLADFDVELHPERPAALLARRNAALNATGCELVAWEPRAGYVAAVAVQGVGEG